MRPACEARILALAARHKRIAYVLIMDGAPAFWELSCKGATSGEAAYSVTNDWVEYLDPDVIILEAPESAVRKSDLTHELLKALTDVAHKSDAMVVTTERQKHFQNQYLEAEAFVEMFPQLRDKLPAAHKIWEGEPRNLIYFEALNLAQSAGFLPKEQMKLSLDDQTSDDAM